MRVVAIPIILLGYIITVTTCDQSYPQEYHPQANALTFDGASDSTPNTVGKRMERRAYTYTAGSPGAKRLPNYNFGLGKRARPYGFGLGKRSDDSDYLDTGLTLDQWRLILPLVADRYDSEDGSEKRARPYSFGLGKRRTDDGPPYDFGVGKQR